MKREILETQNKICDLIMQGKSLIEIANMPDMPSVLQIQKWLRGKSYRQFQGKYKEAWESRAMYLFDEILTIADNKKQKEPNSATVQRDKLKIAARKWIIEQVFVTETKSASSDSANYSLSSMKTQRKIEKLNKFIEKRR